MIDISKNTKVLRARSKVKEIEAAILAEGKLLDSLEADLKQVKKIAYDKQIFALSGEIRETEAQKAVERAMKKESALKSAREKHQMRIEALSRSKGQLAEIEADAREAAIQAERIKLKTDINMLLGASIVLHNKTVDILDSKGFQTLNEKQQQLFFRIASMTGRTIGALQ